MAPDQQAGCTPKRRRKSQEDYLGKKKWEMSPRVSRGSDPEREVVDLKLPDITLKEGAGVGKHTPRGDLPQTARYVPNQKALLKLKGLKYEEAYLRKRAKPEGGGSCGISQWNSEAELDKSLQQYRKKKALQPASEQDNVQDLKLPCIYTKEVVRDNAEQASVRGSLCSGCEVETVGRQNTRDPEFQDEAEDEDSSRANMEMENHVNRVIEEYLETPGFKHRQKHIGRKLGGVVSPVRLIELLKARDPLRMENCFNYYP